MLEENLVAQLRTLQAAFAASLPEKILDLQTLLGPAIAAGAVRRIWPGAALRDAHRIAHSLAGSGGTFGYPALGEAAHRLEEMIAPLLNADALFDDRVSAQLGSGLAAIRTASLALAAFAPEAISVFPTHDPSLRRARPILLIDSSAAQAASLAAQLSHFGYQVQVCASPLAVAPQAKSPLPAVVVMDIDFIAGPQADSPAVQDVLRLRTQGVPVFFMSTRGDFTARLAAVRAGGVAYFTTPIDVGALVNALETFASEARPLAYRVLIVDDSESTAAFYQQVLIGSGMEAMAINDPAQIMAALTDFAPDLILMDIYMPICSGIELATLIRQQPSCVGLPIVFLSTESNINRHLVALRQGGDDFLCKPIDSVRLVSVVTSRAGRGRTLRAQMATDGLTGLLNHSHLKEQLEIEIARSQRQGQPLVFAMIDIDHFKAVNDRWGHAAGDRVLRSLARLLRQRLRRTDVAGRYGGEEFGVILADVDAAAAQLLLDAIRRDFGALRHASGDAEFTVSFSAGIAEFPRHNQADALMAAADAALYRAKQAGRDRIALDASPAEPLPPGV
jgi:diguanylate cyclase (GGDEF)-like protein